MEWMVEDRVFVAQFTKVRDAEAFAVRIAEDGWYVVPGSIERKGRTVTFAWDGRGEGGRSQHFQDMLETVGYFGSPPQGPVATLNGVKAPRSY